VTEERTQADAQAERAPATAAPPGPAAEPERSAPIPHVRVGRLQSFVASVLGPDAAVAVVTSRVPALVELDGRRARDFPDLVSADQELGTAAALAQLEQLRDQGTQFLVIPSFRDTSWLDEHPTFRAQVEGGYYKLADRPNLCAIFDLNRPSAPRRSGHTRLGNLLRPFRRRGDRRAPTPSS
jgi:hypothetical protein